MVIIFVVAIVDYIGCIIVFIDGQDLVMIEFFAYGEFVSGGIVELISVVIRQYPVGITFVESTVVVRRGVRDIFVTRQAMVGIVVVFVLAIGGVRVIREVVW